MKKVLMLLVAGTMLSGMAAYYAGARTTQADRVPADRGPAERVPAGKNGR